MRSSPAGYGVSLNLGVVRDEVTRRVRQLGPVKRAERLLGQATVATWAKLEPAVLRSRRHSPALSDTTQQTMNLIMPLADPSPVGRAKLLGLFMADGDLIISGLRNTGVVHSARFVILDNRLCLFSVYDGDFAAYIRDFIVMVGTFFDRLFGGFVADPPPLPVEQHVDAFVDWVAAHDLVQLPEDITEVCPDLEHLPRCLTVLLHQYPELQIFSYSQYPSYTAAQIRKALGDGW